MLVGEYLHIGTTEPTGATVSYQWQNSESATGPYTDIYGATADTYMLLSDDIGLYINVTVTAYGLYSGTQRSNTTTIVQPSIWDCYSSGWCYMNTDIANLYQWQTGSTACSMPQCTAGFLVNPVDYPNVDFSDYPAQNACKAVGGRLPDAPIQWGNVNWYWTSKQTGERVAESWYGNSTYRLTDKNDAHSVRCVRG